MGLFEQEPFGCYGVVHRAKGKEGDGFTGVRGLEGVFLGYARRSKAKLLYVPEKGTVYVSSSIYLDSEDFPITRAQEEERQRQQLQQNGARKDFKAQ